MLVFGRVRVDSIGYKIPCRAHRRWGYGTRVQQEVLICRSTSLGVFQGVQMGSLQKTVPAIDNFSEGTPVLQIWVDMTHRAIG